MIPSFKERNEGAAIVRIFILIESKVIILRLLITVIAGCKTLLEVAFKGLYTNFKVKL